MTCAKMKPHSWERYTLLVYCKKGPIPNEWCPGGLATCMWSLVFRPASLIIHEYAAPRIIWPISFIWLERHHWNKVPCQKLIWYITNPLFSIISRVGPFGSQCFWGSNTIMGTIKITQFDQILRTPMNPVFKDFSANYLHYLLIEWDRIEILKY